MYKPKTTISAVFASPKEDIERDGRLENRCGEGIRYPFGVLTTDLRVMSSNLSPRTLDLQVTIFTELDNFRFQNTRHEMICIIGLPIDYM